MAAEEELVQKLQDADKELKDARTRVTQLKKEFTDAESNLIEAKLNRDKIIEELRLWRYRNIDDLETTDREEDIERFRKLLPDLLDKVK